ncbi:MAG: HD domain-containing protein [Caldilineaceae bacterium]|nr:HD domain-containing protein [Caldilineaceae bacterium]
MAESEIFSETEAKQIYAANDAAHDFDHVLRVTHMAVHIAQSEGANVEIVRLAALLHDAPGDQQAEDESTESAGRKVHHLAAADFAARQLAARGLGTADIEAVVHCIEAHRFRHRTVEPQTLEAKCLYDADKLDSIGAIGIARVFAYAGAYDNRLWTERWNEAPPFEARPTGADYTPVHEFVYKLQRLLATLHTETAREIGRERHEFMQRFFDRLDAEALGEL